MFIQISSSGFINGSILLKIIGCGYPNLIQITDLSGLSKNKIGSLHRRICKMLKNAMRFYAPPEIKIMQHIIIVLLLLY
jgi:hypothetical protein